MDIQFASRLTDFGEGIFSILNVEKEKLIRAGKKVYNLSVGTPDFQPAPHVMQAVAEAALKPDSYKYSLTDLPELLEAVKAHYKKRFGIEIETDEIMSVYGSQEGITHIGLALCNPGDVVLVPNPGYPIFKIGPSLAGCKTVEYPLSAEHDFLPDLDAIPEETARAARFMIVSYPANPICAVAPEEFYEKLIAFARKYQVVILHDNAYSDIIYDQNEGRSFLSFPGAKDVGVEFYSLSKSYNLTGARISFVVGNAAVVQAFKTIRSQFDYGIFYPVQYAAIAALNGPQDAVREQCREYEARRDALCSGLRNIGWEVPDSRGSMFVWAPLPAGYTNANDFVMELMEKTGVLCTPGSSFGSLGEGYVRLALVLPPEELREAVKSIADSGMIHK